MILPSTAPGPEVPGRAVHRYAESEIPTRSGQLRIIVYREVVDGEPDPQREHVALIVGHPEESEGDVLVRVHSECITSEVFGSLKCDCADQLDAALASAREVGEGIVLYLRQEGRGIGLGNKIRAYELQAKGADTIQANHQLGFETDLRTYDIAAGMLHDLSVLNVALITNNPLKIQGLAEFGISVNRRVAIETKSTPHSEGYLATKRDKLGHMLAEDLSDDS